MLVGLDKRLSSSDNEAVNRLMIFPLHDYPINDKDPVMRSSWPMATFYPDLIDPTLIRGKYCQLPGPPVIVLSR